VVQWAKTTGWNKGGTPGKRETGDTFFEPLAVVLAKLAVVLVGCTYAYISDRRGDLVIEGGLLRRNFNPSDLLRWAPIALGWSIADVAEVMANGKLDAATYTILSQSRLVGTAIVMRAVAGARRSTLQWSILVTLTLVIIGWKSLPNEFYMPAPESKAAEANTKMLGFILTSVKVVLSIVCGVFAQGVLKESAELPFVTQQTQICIVSFVWSSIIVVFMYFYLQPEVLKKPWNYEGGIFGGAENENGVGGFAAGRIYCVIGFYFYREYATNFCVKNFDVLVKNLCNAAAAVLSYYLSALMGDSFNVVKGLFTIVIGMEIMHYAMAPPPPPLPAVERTSSEKAKKMGP
jgi:hypothetical protein